MVSSLKFCMCFSYLPNYLHGTIILENLILSWSRNYCFYRSLKFIILFTKVHHWTLAYALLTYSPDIFSVKCHIVTSLDAVGYSTFHRMYNCHKTMWKYASFILLPYTIYRIIVGKSKVYIIYIPFPFASNPYYNFIILPLVKVNLCSPAFSLNYNVLTWGFPFVISWCKTIQCCCY